MEMIFRPYGVPCLKVMPLSMTSLSRDSTATEAYWKFGSSPVSALCSKVTPKNSVSNRTYAPTGRSNEICREAVSTRRHCERSRNANGEDHMEIIIALAILLAFWVVVIWGASVFNQNVK
jgi:hypothetical protein